MTGSSERERIQRQSSSPSVPGEHHVEHDEVGPVALEELARAVAVVRLERLVARPFEIAHDHLAHDRLVVDHQNRCHPRIVARSLVTRG